MSALRHAAPSGSAISRRRARIIRFVDAMPHLLPMPLGSSIARATLAITDDSRRLLRYISRAISYHESSP